MASLSLIFVNLFAVLCVCASFVFGETGCPPAENIEPCICNDFPSTRLVCPNILNPSIIRNVFENSEGYSYQEVYIKSSSIIYLPHEMFANTTVGELFIEDTMQSTLFDSPPESASFYKFHLDNVGFQRGHFYTSGYLKNVTSLRILSVNGSSMNRIPSDFCLKLPSSLKQITFNGTQIRKIYPGALDLFQDLDKFAVQSSKLVNLTRNMFPQPFNVRFLYFDDNQISTIPDDLFTDMPNLQFLTMRDNLIATIPEPAFAGRSTNVPYFGFEGNPLICDCLLVWIIKDKPEVVGGNCSSPAHLLGQHLQDLSPADFNC